MLDLLQEAITSMNFIEPIYCKDMLLEVVYTGSPKEKSWKG